MQLRHTLMPSLLSIKQNKLHSLLTLLGLAIGIAALVTLNAIISGSEKKIGIGIKDLGAIDLLIQAKTNPLTRTMATNQLTLQDASTLAGTVNAGVAKVSPEIHYQAHVQGTINSLGVMVTGVTPDYMDMRKAFLAKGHFVSWFHVKGHDQIAILGSDIAQSLFGNMDPIAQTIRIDGKKFHVVGSLLPKGEDALGTIDNLILIPITTSYNLLGSTDSKPDEIPLTVIAIDLDNDALVQQSISSIAGVLQLRHQLADTADFTIINVHEILRAEERPSRSLTGFLSAIVGISIALGGFGIMNVMLMSGTQRSREIGIRKVVGATHWNILIQFLMETIVLATLGGIIGLTAGVITSGILSANDTVAIQLELSSGIQALAVAVICGAIFGLYPAIRAANTLPSQSLRHE